MKVEFVSSRVQEKIAHALFMLSSVSGDQDKHTVLFQ